MHTLCEQLHATNMVRLLCVCVGVCVSVCVSVCVFECRGVLECRGAASAVNADVLWCKEDLSSKEILPFQFFFSPPFTCSLIARLSGGVNMFWTALLSIYRGRDV